MALARRRFRPMGFSDILDEAFDLYKTNFVLLAGIAAILHIPINLLNGFSVVSTIRGFMMIIQSPGNIENANRVMSAGGGLRELIVWVLMIIGYPMVIGAFTYSISQRYLDEPATIVNSYSNIWKRLGSYLVTALIFCGLTIAAYGVGYLGSALIAVIIVMLTVAGGAGAPTAAVAIGVILAVLIIFAGLAAASLIVFRLLLMFPVFVVEGKAYGECLTRAWKLSTGYMWRIFGILLVTFIVVAIIQAIALASPVWAAVTMIQRGNQAGAGAIMAAASAVIGTLLAPVYSLIVVLLYYDLRIRKEGFDIQMMARELAIANGQPVPEFAMQEPAAPQQPSAVVEPVAICSDCNSPIYSSVDHTVCPSCGVSMHVACRREYGGCLTPGCPGNRRTAGSQQT